MGAPRFMSCELDLRPSFAAAHRLRHLLVYHVTARSPAIAGVSAVEYLSSPGIIVTLGIV